MLSITGADLLLQQNTAVMQSRVHVTGSTQVVLLQYIQNKSRSMGEDRHSLAYKTAERSGKILM